MVTPETLTDDMVREEWARALDSGDRSYVRDVQIAYGTWFAHALDPAFPGPTGRSERLAKDEVAKEVGRARQRICDAINARSTP